MAVSVRKMTLLALLTATGILLFGAESFLPQPLPGGKIGLSHVATLLALYGLGLPEAFTVVLLRVILVALFGGGFLNPVFWFALGGGVVATGTMGAVKRWARGVSIVGNSMVGAFAHNITQLLLAYFLLVRRAGLFALFPYLTLVSVISGFLVGILSKFLLDYVEKSGLPGSENPFPKWEGKRSVPFRSGKSE